ncbi:NYN domain-containing protein [Thermococcus sp.]|uniref:NYN domain-containing protein n=1 Tax=Thermococcus sp. TaxID=35749 RepID=UPI0019AF7046|nr:NYN domain-containing protein [Thermococcus sp.]MBC7094875.1 NYN domain-containing protein [Thermococcus sp.]
MGKSFFKFLRKSGGEKPIGLIINGPNILTKKFNIRIEDILKSLEEIGKIRVAKVILNQNAPLKLIEAVVNHGLEPVIVSGRADVAVAVEAMKLIYNPKISTLALGVRDAHFLPILFEGKRVGKEVIIIAPSEGLSEALQNTADEIIKLPLSNYKASITLNDNVLRVLEVSPPKSI